MNYYAPKALDEAYTLLRQGKAFGEKVTILAGGTDIVPKRNITPEKIGWFNGEISPVEETVIFIGNLELNYIKDEGNVVRIGTYTTMSEILNSKIILEKLPGLREAISEMAGLTVRNMATIGGNIMNASPAADSIPALIVMGAQAVLASDGGERMVCLCDFFSGPGKTIINDDELLKELIIPVKEGKTKFIKFGRRKAESLSMVNGAVRVVIKDGKYADVNIAVGSVAKTPLRLKKIEEMLIGEEPAPELIALAAEEAMNCVFPIDDKRATAAYRKELTRVLVTRLLEAVN